MRIVEIELDRICEASGNPNEMDDAMSKRLEASLGRYGIVENLVVRPLGDGRYELISGHQRLSALKELGHTVAPCVVLDLSDADARLLGQALNHVRGEDNPGLRAELLREELLESVGETEVVKLLPETKESLKALASLGQEDMASHLQAWQRAQAARLKHFQVQLTQPQMRVVAEAMERIIPKARELQGDSPNLRGTAVYLLCKLYLEAEIDKEITR